MSTKVLKYIPENTAVWNAFIRQSVNGTFLFDRHFMDYHSDRFQDHSLMVYENDLLIGVVPAHQKDNCFYSHRGLTYGVPVFREHYIEQVIDAVLDYLNDSAFAKAEFNLSPQFYHPVHLQIRDRLKASGFTTQRVLSNMFVDLKEDLNISPKKTVGYRNGKFDGFEIEKAHDFKSFWEQVLVPSLKARHDSKPVHSLREIELLGSRFPAEIIQHNLYRDDQLLAGITFFIKGKVIKSQYAASSTAGMKNDAVGFLYMEAMKEYKKTNFDYMDLGPVNESDGTINKGLLRFKKQLGSEVTEVNRYEKIYKRKNHQ